LRRPCAEQWGDWLDCTNRENLFPHPAGVNAAVAVECPLTFTAWFLGLAIDNIRGKIASLRELGFADPVKMITSLPAILGYAMDNIRGRIADLRELGFADPIKMITYFPSILGLAIDNIRGRVADLRELGFSDPVKMVTLNPTILGLAIDNIRGRIADLRELGFNDPVKMVTSRPSILVYARERVLICGRIVMRLEERTDNMFGRLIKESRAVIDTVAVAQPRTWGDVHAIIVMAKRGAAKTAKG
jgi:hypothetical protein